MKFEHIRVGKTYVVSEIMKDLHWFTPGKTVLVERIVSINRIECIGNHRETGEIIFQSLFPEHLLTPKTDENEG